MVPTEDAHHPYVDDSYTESRTRARNAHLATFEAHCIWCGKITEHSVKHGRCLVRFTKLGYYRSAPAGRDRILARQCGSPTYLDNCPTHGLVEFHTIRGKCLKCFTTLGYPRRSG